MHATRHSTGFFARLARLVRHRLAEGSLSRVLPDDVSERLAQRVTASEQRHTGQIRICVEGGLPLSYIWRSAGARERAVTQFGKLRVWDTEHNNGVLIYLLVAEHAIEIVADRGIARNVDPKVWHAVIARMREQFREGHYEDGLTEAIANVSAALVEQYPANPDALQRHANELPDTPIVIRT
ncbi:TPM domain-containing protein [Diaphorobacter aerolatus]|uniref:TPM domain-containing protein n=1 Tax=Diaphorobacter aerolatus TaxID=1288495 RepID=A0A7H0GQE1_9BURK|nr:TPM domain-containing protein [Diaphorobacter aerolatus]QNP50507.1 TPM domain-containing protein [Diaphorobacter aerolatus]